jgi:hypothetical protein
VSDSAATVEGQEVTQIWWPHVTLVWVPLVDVSPPSARYLGIQGDKVTVITGSPDAFNELTAHAETPPISPQSEAHEVVNYAAFYVEVIRPMMSGTLIVNGDCSDHPLWPVVSPLVALWPEFDAAERKELLTRLARMQDGLCLDRVATAIRARRRAVADEDGIQALISAGFSAPEIQLIDYLRRLPPLSLTAPEAALLIRAQRVFFSVDAGRGVQFLSEEQALGPHGLIQDGASGRPGTRWGAAVGGLAGDVVSESVAQVARDPMTGLISSVGAADCFMVSVSLRGWAPLDREGRPLEQDGMRRMWGALPVPEIGRYGAKDGGPVPFEEGDELYWLDARGHASLMYRWGGDKAQWQSYIPDSAHRDEPAPASLPQSLEALAAADNVTPVARREDDGWRVDGLMVVLGTEVYAVDFHLDSQGCVNAEWRALI